MNQLSSKLIIIVRYFLITNCAKKSNVRRVKGGVPKKLVTGLWEG